MSVLHKSTKRDYLARVNDPEFPKARVAALAKKWDFDYWDGDRRVNYGGYQYVPGRWEKVARAMAGHYGLGPGDRILDVGCGKGFLLFDFTQVVPGVDVYGLDISQYAIDHAKEEVRERLRVGHANALPYPDRHFDLVYSINTLHNLHYYQEMMREMRAAIEGGRLAATAARLLEGRRLLL